MPHGLTRLGSMVLAGTAPSETRFVCWKRVSAAAGAMPAAHKPAAPATVTMRAARCVDIILLMCTMFSRVLMGDRTKIVSRARELEHAAALFILYLAPDRLLS